MDLAEKISNLRGKKGYCLKAVAKYLDIDEKLLLSYEKGEKTPDLSMSMKIADFYGVSVDDLLDGSKEIASKPASKKEKRLYSQYWNYHLLTMKKKVIPVILFSIFGLPLLIIGLVFFFPNFQNSSTQMLATIALIIAILGFLMLVSIPFLITSKIKEYDYEGHNILCYSSIYNTMLIVDGYAREQREKEEKKQGKEGPKYSPIKTKINGKAIVLKIDDSRSFVLETQEGFPIKSKRQTGRWKKEK